MKKQIQFTDIGLEDLALVGGGCRKNHCEPKPCDPNPCGPKLTMSTAPDTAGLATVPGSSGNGINVDISIGGFSASFGSGGDDQRADTDSNALPGTSVSIST